MRILSREEATTVERPTGGYRPWKWPEPVNVAVSNCGLVSDHVFAKARNGDPLDFALAVNYFETLYDQGYAIVKLDEEPMVDLAKLMASDPEGTIVRLNAAQLDGTACARCGAPAASAGDGIAGLAMVPLTEGSSLFVCEPSCQSRSGPAAAGSEEETTERYEPPIGTPNLASVAFKAKRSGKAIDVWRADELENGDALRVLTVRGTETGNVIYWDASGERKMPLRQAIKVAVEMC